MIIIPDKVQAARLLITFLITAGVGIHAYILFKTAARRRDDIPGASLDNPLRLGFLLYALLFLFTAVLNFVYLLITVAMRSYGSGPFKLGMLSLILVVSYVIVVFGGAYRRRAGSAW